MRWTALVPLKGEAERKSRLASRLSPVERTELSDRMMRHVCAVLADVAQIDRALLMSPHPVEGAAGWYPDRGGGLNATLQNARDALGMPLLVIHADLPLLEPADVVALLCAAEAGGVAIALDRHGAGTNALALAAAAPTFRFAFGEGSFRRHQAAAGRQAASVERWRLSLDIDTPDDLDAAIARFCAPALIGPVQCDLLPVHAALATKFNHGRWRKTGSAASRWRRYGGVRHRPDPQR